MNQLADQQNYGCMSQIWAGMTFPYIWGGLLGMLYLLYNAHFFGESWVSYLVAALSCLFMVLPAAPAMVTKLVVQPLYHNLLAREIISTKAGLAGILSFFATYMAVIFFIGRDLTVAGWLFLAAPVVGFVIAGLVTLAERITRFPPSGGGRGGAGDPRIGPPKPTDALPPGEKRPGLPLPKPVERPALPTPGSRRPESLPRSLPPARPRPTRDPKTPPRR